MTSKPRLLFVDHVFHKKTRSSDFMQEILRAAFDVHVIYVDAERPLDYTTLEDPADHVLIWQMDFLTPWFLAQGKRVTVAQMYDGSAALPDGHYHLNAQARYLNFSVTMHSRALELGLESHLIRYFPDPSEVKQVKDFKTIRGFFWQRRPNSPINLDEMARMLGGEFDRLHVHTPTDDDSVFDPSPLARFECPVTTSDWFESQAEFTATMERCNVFIAPRPAEGIGLAFLEAMARGMVVLAYDLPTHNEYIGNWMSGVLFSGGVDRISLRAPAMPLKELGANARLAVERGHGQWRQAGPGICRFVMEATPAHTPDIPEMPSRQHMVKAAIAAYQNGLGRYVSFLQEHSAFCTAFGTWRDIVTRIPEIEDQATARKTDVEIFFGQNGGHRFLQDGWSTPEVSHIWAVARRARLTVPLAKTDSFATLTIEMRAVKAQCPLTVALNGVTIGSLALSDEFGRHSFAIPSEILTPEVKALEVTFSIPEDEELPQVEPRPLSYAIKSLALSV